VGEMATIPTPEAIAPTIKEAVGVWIKDLSIAPEKVWKALREKKEPWSHVLRGLQEPVAEKREVGFLPITAGEQA